MHKPKPRPKNNQKNKPKVNIKVKPKVKKKKKPSNKYVLMLSRPKDNQPTILGKYRLLSQAQSAYDHFMRKNAEYKAKTGKLGFLYFGLKVVDSEGNEIKLQFLNKGQNNA